MTAPIKPSELPEAITRAMEELDVTLVTASIRCGMEGADSAKIRAEMEADRVKLRAAIRDALSAAERERDDFHSGFKAAVEAERAMLAERNEARRERDAALSECARLRASLEDYEREHAEACAENERMRRAFREIVDYKIGEVERLEYVTLGPRGVHGLKARLAEIANRGLHDVLALGDDGKGGE